MNYGQHIFCISLIFLLYSCASPSPAVRVPAAPAGIDAAAERKAIAALTDKVLMSLATHRYENLEPILYNDRAAEGAGEGRASYTGQAAAYRLLGPDAFTAIIERWNAETIEISFGKDYLWATSRINVEIRSRPNRKPKVMPFDFIFHRSDLSSRWQLYPDKMPAN